MFTLIIGGSACGKSSYAERLTVSLPGEGPRIYLATMEAFGAEAQARIVRHRQMRRGRGFETLECTRNLTSAQIPPGSNVLLEDMGNLVANELFGEPDTVLPEGTPEDIDMDLDPVLLEGTPAHIDITSKILEGVEDLRSCNAHLTIVTNDVFSAGNEYAGDTDRYLRVLADVNRALAMRADRVVEVVCGQPVVLSDRAEICADAANLCGTRSNCRNCLCEPVPDVSAQKSFGMPENVGSRSEKEAGMIFVTGPLYAGKQEYIMRALDWDEADFASKGIRDVQELAAEAVREVWNPVAEASQDTCDQAAGAVRDVQEPGAPAYSGAAGGTDQGPASERSESSLLRERLMQLADRLAEKKVVIATEVGGGVVPMDPMERREREAAGRLSCLLAERAQRVIRVCCGLPQILK